MTGQMAREDGAVRIGGRYEWTMQAANGWKVVARSQSAAACSTGPDANKYEVSFFRGAETTPFEKLTGTLSFSLWGNRNYNFSLSSAEATLGGMENYQALMQKLSDPKLTSAEREQLMKKLEEAQKQMQAAISKMTDPAYVKQRAQEQQRREQEFGCRQIYLAVESGKATGEMNCSDKVGRPGVTGTVAIIK